MDLEGSNLRRALSTSTPFLLGTGSTGMLLISNNPIGDQSPSKSYRGLDRMTERLSASTHHRSSMDHLLSERPRSPNRSSVGGHSDSGISNSLSISSGSRYKPDNGLDRNYHDYSHLDTFRDHYDSSGCHFSPSGNSNTNHTMNSPNHRHNLSHLTSNLDNCPTGRSHSLTRLNLHGSPGWKSPAPGSPSAFSTRAHTGSTIQDTSRRECEDVHQALEDSETRRHLLVERLRDAQETIRFQAQRISELENTAKHTAASVDDIRFKEKELTKKLNMLEREKNSYYEKHMESLKAREQLQHRVEALSTEVASLRTTMELVQSDMARKDKTIAHLTSSVNELQECNEKLAKNKESLLRELDSVRQSLDLCRSHSEYLEGQDKEYRSDIDKLREENQALILEKRSLAHKIAALETKNYSVKEDNKILTSTVQKLTEEKQQLSKQMSALQDTITDLRSSLAVNIADKERFFQEKLELSNQIQKISYERANWNKLRVSLEEQVTELIAELEKKKQEVENYSDEKRKYEDEINTIKQVSEVLSAELSKVKTQLEHSLERNKSLEQTKTMALKQHELYEQEIQSLETQLKQSKEALAVLKTEYQQSTDNTEQSNKKVKEELQELRSERNQMEIRCHEAEAKLHQAEQNLTQYSGEHQRELQNWKTKCEKLAASNSHKDMELEVTKKRVQDLEDQVGYLKVNHDVYQAQFEELTEARSELKRFQEENRRLLQERAENQQVIQLLEMQKDILTKTNEDTMNKVQDVEQLQYTVEQLKVEKQDLRERLNAFESKEKERQAKEHPSNDRDKSRDLPEPIREQINELEARNSQLKEIYTSVAEKLILKEQENISLQNKYRDCVSRSEYRSLESKCEQLENTNREQERQLSMLKQQNKQLLENNNKKLLDSQGMWAIQKEKEDLENQVSVISDQITLLEEEKEETTKKNTQLQKQLDAVHEKLFNLCHEDNSHVIALQNQIKQLTAELENAKQVQDNQDNLIQSLKEELDEEKTKKPSRLTQSLDAVGEDLTAVRTELHKLGDVIRGKDLQIEELESQLIHLRKQLADREKQIEKLTTGTGSGKDENEYNANHNKNDKTIQRQLEERVEELEDEKIELSDQTLSLRRQVDLARREVEELKETLEDMKKVCENEHIRQLDKLRKDVAAKDRQIESLEEQLRRHTNVEIKKLKRGASKVELLKAENRRLQSQLSQPSSHVTKFSDHSPVRSASPPPPSRPGSIGMRLGERLQGNLASTTPSQRLLSRLYGDDYSKESALTSGSASEQASNSWEDSSSEEDAMSPTCATEETMSPVGMAKEIRNTKDELKLLEAKRRNNGAGSLSEYITQNGVGSGSEAAAVNGHDGDLNPNAHQSNGKATEGVVAADRRRQSWNLPGNLSQNSNGARH